MRELRLAQAMMDEFRLNLVRYALVYPNVGLVLLRPIVPEDEDLAAGAFARLSPQSRIHRFWTYWKTLPQHQLKALITPDGRNHGGWILIDPSPEADFPAFGASSFWRDRKNLDRAEVSFTVADEWQRHGLGTLLLAALWISAWEVGIERFFAVVEPGNSKVAAWFERLGAEVRETGRQFEVELNLEKPSDIADGAFETWREPLSRHRFALCVRTLLSQDELAQSGSRVAS